MMPRPHDFAASVDLVRFGADRLFIAAARRHAEDSLRTMRLASCYIDFPDTSNFSPRARSLINFSFRLSAGFHFWLFAHRISSAAENEFSGFYAANVIKVAEFTH
jgi:hypothetical protein